MFLGQMLFRWSLRSRNLVRSFRSFHRSVAYDAYDAFFFFVCLVSKQEAKQVKRVPSFMNLDDEVHSSYHSLPFMGAEAIDEIEDNHVRQRDEDLVDRTYLHEVPDSVSPVDNNNHNNESSNNNNNDGVYVADESLVAAAVAANAAASVNAPPKVQYASPGGYNMSAITDVHEIEKMSGPLLRGYLKAVGIDMKGKRPDLMVALIREFHRYQDNPDDYMESVDALQLKETPSMDAAALSRRQKKRSLKAREAAETGEPFVSSPPSVRKNSRSGPSGGSFIVGSSGSSGGGGGGSPGSVGVVSPGASDDGATKRIKPNHVEDPEVMPEDLRLRRYEMLARQLIWGATGAPPPANPSALLRSVCGLISFNANGVAVQSKDAMDQFSPELNMIGRRIEVAWIQDTTHTECWYAGTVVKLINGSRSVFAVVYDDGEQRNEK